MTGPNVLSLCLLLVGAAAACVAEPEGIHPLTHSSAGSPASEGASGASPAALDACEARLLLAEKCERCHGEPLAHGAPFSFSTSDDRARVDAKGVSRSERMAQAIERGNMPALFIELEPPVESLTDEERDTLVGWLRTSGTASEPAACE